MEVLSIKQMKQLTAIELNNKIKEVQYELFDLKFQQATKKTLKTHLLKQHRRTLAQLLTVETQLEYNK